MLRSADTYPRGVRFAQRLGRIWAMSLAPGVSPVLRYLASTNELSRRHMNALITHVDEYGFHHNPKRYRHIAGPIVELKVKDPKAIRVLAYRLPDGGHVLLLGFDKGDGPIPADIMKRAREMAREFEDGGMKRD